jgi:hypothetical protein
MQSVLGRRNHHSARKKTQAGQASIHKSLPDLPLPPLHHHDHRQGVQLAVTQQGLLDL